ncbi:VOC family protein [Mycolicibacterium goodii]|uniref:VOC family protein n=1 Tax=Mycolicibacterium goodii TaxID=134601 RepID=UPI00256F3A8A|nr:VOC family protein [Mycolicibacterium goodii]
MSQVDQDASAAANHGRKWVMASGQASSHRRVAVNDVAAVVATGRFDEAVVWYGCVFGREPDLLPMPGVAEWQLTSTAWLQLVTDEARAGRTAVRFGVDDLAQTRAALAERGVTTAAEPQVIADMVAVLDVADPDGNEVSFVQELA